MRLKSLLILCILPALGWSQDPIFTQYYNVPEALNPAFVASANTWNAGVIHRRQWPNDNRRIDTQYGYVSNLITDELGIGGNVQNHTEIFTGYNYIRVNAVVSYRVDLTYDWHLRFGLEGGYGQKDYGFGGLLLEDQINVATGAIDGPTIDPQAMRANKLSFFDFSGGVVADSENAWFGLTVRHLTRPDISFTESSNVPLNMFVSVHGGYFFDLGGLPSVLFPDGSSFMLSGNYMRQAEYNRFDVGGIMDYGLFSIGVLSAVNLERKASNAHLLTSVNPVFSVTFGELTFGYSYDINTSGIGRTGGVHELSLVWQSSRDCSKCDNYKVRLKRRGEDGYTR